MCLHNSTQHVRLHLCSRVGDKHKTNWIHLEKQQQMSVITNVSEVSVAKNTVLNFQLVPGTVTPCKCNYNP